MLQLQAKLSGQSAFVTVATVEDKGGDQALVSILWSKQTNWIDASEARAYAKTLEKVYKARNKGSITKIVNVVEVEEKSEVKVIVAEVRDAEDAVAEIADEVEIGEEIADDESEVFGADEVAEA